jgi:hypothetical protein
MRKLFYCLLAGAGMFCGSAAAQSPDSLVVSIDTLPRPMQLPIVQDSLSSDTSVLSITAAKTPIVSKPISARSILIPAAMITYGAFTFANKDLKNLNLAVRKEVWEQRESNKGIHIDDFTLVAPIAAVYGLNMAGVKGKHNFVDRSLILGMSQLIGQTLIVSNVKRLSKVIRPDSSNRLSFPSGHTTQAFISAEFLRQEYKHLSPWYGIAGYAVAAGTGFLRMYNNKHWLNDVIAGAGVGILSTRLSYWLYPKLKNTFLKKFKGNTMVAPTYQNGAVGVGLVHQFK